MPASPGQIALAVVTNGVEQAEGDGSVNRGGEGIAQTPAEDSNGQAGVIGVEGDEGIEGDKLYLEGNDVVVEGDMSKGIGPVKVASAKRGRQARVLGGRP